MADIVYTNPITQQEVKVKYGITVEELVSYIDIGQYLYCDTETFNDSKYYKGDFFGKVRLAQFKQAHWDFTVIIDLLYGSAGNTQAFHIIDIIVRGSGNTLPHYMVGYNFAYDYITLQEHAGILQGKISSYKRVQQPYYTDLLFYVRELSPLQKADVMSGRFSLDDSYEALLGFDPYAQFGLEKKKLQKSKWGGTLTSEMLIYATLDVEYMPALHSKLMEIESVMYQPDTLQRRAYDLRLHNAHLAVDMGLKMQDVGLCLDIDEAKKYYNKYNDVKKTAWHELLLQGVPDKFNPTSHTQVKAFTGLPKSDKVTLKFAQHVDKNPVVASIMAYRQGSSRSSTVAKWVELVKDYGRVHGHFQPTTTTGRFSSSQENMQNQPRDSKGVFKAPEGAILIGFDYAQIELRTMCALTGDERMYQTFREFGDIHQNTKDMCRLTERVVAKQVNFGSLYGMGAKKFQELLIKDDIYLPIDTIKEIRKLFYGTYIRIPEYHERGVHNTKHGIPNYSLLGHPYYSKFFNQMNNLANQASGTSEVAKMFFSLADEIGLTDSPVCELSVQIHDSNLFNYYGKLEYTEHYAYAIGLLAQKAWAKCLAVGYELGTSKYLDIPMPVEVGMHSHWKNVDDNIVVDMQGLEYYSNQASMDSWLDNFRDIHNSNVVRSLL